MRTPARLPANRERSAGALTRRVAVICALALASIALGATGLMRTRPARGADALLPYQNTGLPFEVRAADLVSRMTLQEETHQLRAFTQGEPGAPGIPRLGLAPYSYWSEDGHGVARAGE